MDTSDPRFADVFSNANFAIDRTHSKFKETPGMQQILQEKIRRSEKSFSESTSSGAAPSGGKRKAAESKPAPSSSDNVVRPKRKRRKKKKKNKSQ